VGNIVSRHLIDQVNNSDDNQKEKSLFDEKVGQQLGELFKELELTTSFDVSVITPDYEVYDNNKTKTDLLPEIDKLVGASEYDPEVYNGYITAEVLLPKGDEFRVGTVVKRKQMVMVNR
jgi:hypothetical protein